MAPIHPIRHKHARVGGVPVALFAPVFCKIKGAILYNLLIVYIMA